jgi:hypothetical protein
MYRSSALADENSTYLSLPRRTVRRRVVEKKPFGKMPFGRLRESPPNVIINLNAIYHLPK